MSDLLFHPPTLKKKKKSYRFRIEEGFLIRRVQEVRTSRDHLYFLAEKQDSITTSPSPLGSDDQQAEEKKLGLYQVRKEDTKAGWFLEAEISQGQAFDLNHRYLLWQQTNEMITLRGRRQNAFNAEQHIFSAPAGKALGIYIASDKIWLINDEKEGGRVYHLENNSWREDNSYRSSEGFTYKRSGQRGLLFYPQGLATFSSQGPEDIFLSPMLPENPSPNSLVSGENPGQYFLLDQGELFLLDLRNNNKKQLATSQDPEAFLVSGANLLALVERQATTVFRDGEHLFSFRREENFSRGQFFSQGLFLWRQEDNFYQKILFSF